MLALRGLNHCLSAFSVSVFQCVSVWNPATLLRDSDKIPELMNFHRRSDTPLAPPICLRLVDRHFWIRLGSIRASRVVLGALAEQLFLISGL